MSDWQLIKAIYGPEGFEYDEVTSPEWYATLAKEIENDGESSIYGYGYILAKVVDFNGKKIATHSVSGGDEGLKHFAKLTAELEEAKKLYKDMNLLNAKLIKRGSLTPAFVSSAQNDELAKAKQLLTRLQDTVCEEDCAEIEKFLKGE